MLRNATSNYSIHHPSPIRQFVCSNPMRVGSKLHDPDSMCIAPIPNSKMLTSTQSPSPGGHLHGRRPRQNIHRRWGGSGTGWGCPEARGLPYQCKTHGKIMQNPVRVNGWGPHVLIVVPVFFPLVFSLVSIFYLIGCGPR